MCVERIKQPFTTSDRELWFQVYKKCFEKDHQYLESKGKITLRSSNTTLAYCLVFGGKEYVYVAYVDNKPVGYLTMDSKGHIFMLMVNPQYQKIGIGASLLNRAIDDFPGDTTLDYYVSSEHLALYYTKFGFVEVGRCGDLVEMKRFH